MADQDPPDGAGGLNELSTAFTKMGSASFGSIDNNSGAAVGNAVNSKVTGTHLQARNMNIYIDGGKTADYSTGERGPFFTVPFEKDKKFVGREGIMAKLESEARKSRGYHTRVALIGTGGMGKSQVAIEYAYRVRRTSPNLSVFWVYASSKTRFEEAYRDIAETLKLPEREDPQANILQLVYRWLSNKVNGPWLMILDNVDDVSILNSADTGKKPLSDWIPQTENGSVLVTSRDYFAAENVVGDPDNIIQVDVMDMADALGLLKSKHRYEESDTPAAKELVTALEYIPLAIVQAGSFLGSPTRITTSQYLKLLQESEKNLKRLLNENENGNLRCHYTAKGPVMTTWYTSFKQIQESMPQASDLLALMSMFDRQGIPEILLQTDLDKLAFEDAITTLKGYSLIRQGQAEDLFDMHRLVQLSVREWLDSRDQLDKWIGISINIVHKLVPIPTQDVLPSYWLTLPHARAVIASPPKDKVMLSTWSKIVTNMGWHLYLEGKNVEAETMFRRGIEKLEDAVDDDTLPFLDGICLALIEQKKYEEAEMEYRRTLERSEKAFGRCHPCTLERNGKLSLALAGQGKHEEAAARQRQFLEETEKELGGEHVVFLDNIRILAEILHKQEKYDEAEAIYRRALERSEKVLGCNHLNTLNCLYELGLTLDNQGKFLEAETMYRRALEVYEKVLGPENPWTRSASCNLDYTIRRQRDEQKCEGKREQRRGEPPSTMGRIFRGFLEMMGVTRPDPL